jgi:Flp pilus assembly protein TadG
MHMRLLRARENRVGSARSFLSRFARDEDGAMVVFGVYMFLIILMVGGIGIDLMRFERERANLQYTLDRAVLAAADLDQTLSPSDVVADYFAKAGLSEYLTSVTVDEGLGYRVVSGTAMADVQTLFMRMTGVDTLAANTASTAEERIDSVEISLILDVSGSMNSNSRLANLKVAARDFIDDMVENTEDGKLAISIIPYATQVAMSSEFINEFNITQEQTYSNCVNFQAADYQSSSVSLVDEYQRTMHFSPWGYYDGRDNDPVDLVRSPVCDPRASREMLVLQKDANVLKTFISNLSATGNTSIDIGMKWGTALLDPSMAPVVDNLIASGTVDAAFSELPRPYDASDTIKVIVLMTDGQNTSQYYVTENFRQGNSNVWWNESRERYSVYDPDEDEYYWPFSGDWESTPYDDSGNGTAVRLSYPDLWAYTSLAWNARYNYGPWLAGHWNNWYYPVFDSVNSTAKNAQTRNICDAAKAQQIIVFTIGFEAPSSGQAVLADCASSPGHYFDVDGLEINEAFSAIASSIRKLRLTQ